jgi:hypothetical protein
MSKPFFLNDGEVRKLSERIIEQIQKQDTVYDEIEAVERILGLYKMTLKLGPTSELLPENCGHNTEWDYKGWKEHAAKDIGVTQNDWNQTLLTKFNFISSHINRESFRGGASFVLANPHMKSLFETIEYYDKDETIFGGRYKVIYYDTIPMDVIYLHAKEWNNVLFVAKGNKGKLTEDPDGSTSQEMGEVTLKHFTQYPTEEVIEFNNNLIGYVKILNLPKVEKV